MFEKTHPRLALIVGLRCYGRDRIAARLFTRSLQMLREVPDPGYYEITAVAYVLQNNQSNGRLTGAQRTFLDDLLIDWYATLNKAVPGRVQIFHYVCSLLARRSDLDDYVRFLDAEVTGTTNAPSPAASAPRPRPMIWPLDYPPRQVPGVPDHVASMVLDGPRQYFPRPAGARTPKFDPARQGRHLDAVNHPTLKILIAMASGRDTATRELTATFLKDNPTSLAAYVLTASQAAVDGKPLEVVNLLEKARALPASPPCRRQLDGALVAAALELDPQKHATEIELGKRAAIRLLGNRLTPDQQEELLVATETLGLTEQAQNLRKQILASAVKPSAAPGRSSASYIHPFTVTLIERFFENGQTDSALRLALTHLKNESYNARRYGYALEASPPAEKIVDLIRTHNALEQLVARAAPPETASASRFVEYGRTCEMMSRRDDAIAAYENAVAQSPEDADARMQLALLTAETNPSEAARHLSAIDRRRVNGAGLKLVRSAEHLFSRGLIERPLGIARTVTAYLDLVEEPEHQNLDWVDKLAEVVAGPSYSRANWLHPLYQRRSLPTNNPTRRRRPSSVGTQMVTTPGGTVMFTRRMQMNWNGPPRENTRTAETRRKVHNQLCHKMLEIPQLAEIAFARLAGEARARGAVTHAFTEMARQAMLTHQPYPGATPPSGAPSQQRRVRLAGPAEHLVTQAHKSGTLDRLVAEFSPLLKQSGSVDQTKKLNRFVRLYRAPPERFFDAGDDFLTQASRQNSAGGQTFLNEDTAFECVIDAYLARELNTRASMEQFILEQIEKDIAQGRFVRPQPAEHWLRKLMEDDRTSARRFVDMALRLCRRFPGQTAALSSTLKVHARILANDGGNRTLNQPSTARVKPAPTTSTPSRTSRSRRSRSSAGNRRTTRRRIRY